MSEIYDRKFNYSIQFLNTLLTSIIQKMYVIDAPNLPFNVLYVYSIRVERGQEAPPNKY